MPLDRPSKPRLARSAAAGQPGPFMVRPVANDGGMMPSAEALRAMVGKLRGFSPLTRHRGQAYARDGRVGGFGFDDEGVHAAVRGTEVYEAAWHWDPDDGQCAPRCTCPV